MLSDKKKNTEASYTLDELETEINSLSGPEGKTVTFRNLDSTGKQHIEVIQPQLSWSQDNGNDLSITSKYPTINFWVSSSEGYVPGTLDHESPLDLSTISDDMVITASTGYMQSGEKQLVDMSKWYNNNKNTAFDSDGNFTNATLDYFKSVKPTNLNHAFTFYRNLNKNILNLNLLDTSECTDFRTFLYVYSDIGEDTSSIIANLSSLNTSNVTDFNYCLSFSGFSFGSLVIDISSWDTSKGENFENFLYFFASSGNTLTIKGIIDLSSDKTNYDGNFEKFIINTTKLTEPIKFKNVPSDFNWQNMGFTSEDQFQILSYR